MPRRSRARSALPPLLLALLLPGARAGSGPALRRAPGPPAFAEAARQQARQSAREEPPAAQPCSAGQCTPDMLPLMKKIETVYMATDCLVQPPAEDRVLPIAQVIKAKQIEDGACHFNYFPWCSTARRAGDYFASVLPVSGVHARYDPRDYDLGEVQTAPGVSPLGAKLCHDNGFLDLPDEFLWNFTLLDDAAAKECEKLREEVPEWELLSFQGMSGLSEQEGLWSPPGSINLKIATKAQMRRHEVWKCAMGHHVLACDMAECIYNYCRLPDGRIGSGKQCRKDWLDPELVEKHHKIFAEPTPPPPPVPPCAGGQCTPDMLPLMEKISRPKTPPECSVKPPVEDLSRPIVDVLKEKQIEDGACYFNFFPWCTAAKRAGDYFASVLPVSIHHAYYEARTYFFGEFATVQGVSPLGAKMCFDNGYLDLPDEFLWNFTLLDAVAARRCERVRQEVPEWNLLSHAALQFLSSLEGNWAPPGSVNGRWSTRDEMLRHEAWKCALGHHVVACDIAECVYNYCKLAEGRVGSGKQCRKDWLDPELVEKHWAIYEG